MRFQTAVRALKHRGWVEPVPEMRSALRLTVRGQAQAERLDRAHRLWETYLVEQVGVASDHVHPAAEEVEHALSEQLVERVDDVLGHPVIDPHGAPIPRSPVADGTAGNYTLSKLRVGDCAWVVGLADLAAGMTTAITASVPAAPKVADLGLTLGQTFEVIEHQSAHSVMDRHSGRRPAMQPVPHELADLVLVQIVELPLV